MPWQLFISLKILTARHRTGFLSLISLISILGIAVGVAALIIVISVMSGFDDELKEKIVGTYSHIEILSDYGIEPTRELTAKIARTEHVVASSFFLNAQALAKKGDTVTGILAKGIVAEDEVRVKRLGEYIKQGSLDLKDGGAVVGSELASRLNVRIGDEIILISASGAVSRKKALFGAEAPPEEKVFRVRGIFTSGMYEYDANLVYIDISKAQELLKAGNLAGGVAVSIDDMFNVNGVKKDLSSILGPEYTVRTWMDSNRNILEALKLEKTVMFLILTLIVTVACFNIASTLIMTVLEKTREIGILKAIGASRGDIKAIFALQGGIIGVIGTCLGTAIGLFGCWALKTYKFIALPKDIYYIDRLPAKVEPADIAVIVAASVIISLIATIYPARMASRLEPAEAMRYE